MGNRCFQFLAYKKLHLCNNLALLKQYEINSILLTGEYGSIGISDLGDKKIVNVEIHSKGEINMILGETLTHEMNLHGYKFADKIEGKNKNRRTR